MLSVERMLGRETLTRNDGFGNSRSAKSVSGWQKPDFLSAGF
jgi:hypothetical protein